MKGRTEGPTRSNGQVSFLTASAGGAREPCAFKATRSPPAKAGAGAIKCSSEVDGVGDPGPRQWATTSNQIESWIDNQGRGCNLGERKWQDWGTMLTPAGSCPGAGAFWSDRSLVRTPARLLSCSAFADRLTVSGSFVACKAPISGYLYPAWYWVVWIGSRFHHRCISSLISPSKLEESNS